MNGKFHLAREPADGCPMCRKRRQRKLPNSDPQRQHAQLLGVWAQGNKLLRRLDHHRLIAASARSHAEQWWHLAQRLEARGLWVRPLPLLAPILMVGWPKPDPTWVVLADPSQYPPSPAFEQTLWVRFGVGPAWETDADGRMSCRAELVERLGLGLWRGLVELLVAPTYRPLYASTVAVSLDILAAWVRVRPRLQTARPQDWPQLARLWRHRGVWLPQSPPGWARDYPWLQSDPDAHRVCWPILEDEDSAH